ncbi:MAG: hypothetical protein ABSE63_10100 [Thermoguttaceae bacterium]
MQIIISGTLAGNRELTEHSTVETVHAQHDKGHGHESWVKMMQDKLDSTPIQDEFPWRKNPFEKLLDQERRKSLFLERVSQSECTKGNLFNPCQGAT